MTDVAAARPLRGREGEAIARTGHHPLRRFAIVAGLLWSVAFIALGLGYELQLYGDGREKRGNREDAEDRAEAPAEAEQRPADQ